MRNLILFWIILLLLFQTIISFTFAKEPLQLSPTVISELEKLTLEWVVPNSSVKFDSQKKVIFDVDKNGQPWIGITNKLLLNPLRKQLFILDTEYQDFAFLDTAEFIVASKEALGMLIVSDSKKYLEFIPMLKIPFKETRLFSTKGAGLYLVGYNSTTNTNDLYLLIENDKGGRIEKIFSTKEIINDVCGDGRNTYVALGKLIIKILPQQKDVELILKHKEEIKNVEFANSEKLFYTTASTIGFISQQKAIDFLKIPNVKIKIFRNNLYLLIPETLAVIKIDNIDKLIKN
ncbi:MAG: hypothetical protein N2606_02680 [Candidatus Omnitrophica bacterium]|nr:hypothetical protein [Candidatus Omnitrophota bacterium]